MSLNRPLGPWPGKRAWIVGASSGIGRALALQLLDRGAHVVVSARDRGALDAIAQHAPARATVLPLDVAEGDVAAAARIAGPLDLVVYCAGYYREMRAGNFDLAVARRHVDVNYTGALRVLQAVLPRLGAQGHGHISLVASVAGYRGLPLALAYGPTKAALINLAETLYMDLRGSGVGVSVVNPGFVQTPMTAGNRFRMPALVTAEDAAAEILRGWEHGRFEIHFPRRFTLALKLLGLLPFGAYQAVVRRGTRT